MTRLPSAPCGTYRLISDHGTALYYDDGAGQILHGDPAGTPQNLVVEIAGRRGRLCVLGSRVAPLCHVASFSDQRLAHIEPGRGSAWCNVEQVDGDHIGLSFDGTYFSCEPDGRVVYNRTQLHGWEVLRVEPVGPFPYPATDTVLGQVDSRSQTLSVEPAGDGMLTVRRAASRQANPRSFAVAGPFNGSWSLAAVNRRLAAQLERAAPGMVRVLADDAPISDAGGEQIGPLHALADCAAARDSQQVVIHQRWPITAPGARGDIRLAYFFWEESRVPQDIVDTFNGFDGVLVPAEFIRGALLASGLQRPVVDIGYSPDLAPFLAPPPIAPQRRPFTFLHVSALLPRKGLDVLLKAYERAFQAEDSVRLVIKGPPGRVSPMVEAMRAANPALPEIVVMGADMVLADLVRLYHDSDAMVLPARGEGFNIPAAEAIAAGLGLIVTGYGGHMQFCNRRNARLIDYSLVRAESHFALDHSLWAEPSVDDLAAAMREAASGKQAADPAEREATLRLLDGAAWIARLTVALDSGVFG